MDLTSLAVALGSGSIITYILGWLAGMKKSKADLESKRLRNIRDSIEIYHKIHEDMMVQFNDVSTRCIKLSTDIEVFRKENKVLETKISLLSNEIDSLREENVELKKKIYELKLILQDKNK